MGNGEIHYFHLNFNNIKVNKTEMKEIKVKMVNYLYNF